MSAEYPPPLRTQSPVLRRGNTVYRSYAPPALNGWQTASTGSPPGSTFLAGQSGRHRFPLVTSLLAWLEHDFLLATPYTQRTEPRCPLGQSDPSVPPGTGLRSTRQYQSFGPASSVRARSAPRT